MGVTDKGTGTGPDIKPEFTRKGMVDWFSPSELAKTGLRAVISSVFGDYADKREVQAALDLHQDAMKPFDYSDRDELWIDYVSDLGSGWDSTYSVAYLLGQSGLDLTGKEGDTHRTRRGDILVMGGDEVYPTATPEEYRNRLVGPYSCALPYSNEEQAPNLFAIPGNHDWYDGLSSFIKLFCQQRWIGGWKTRQTRSYFAARLPHNWWLWGIDIQLSADLDKPQIDYFDAMHRMAEPGDKIILCTAEPVWVYQQYQPDDKPYRNLRFFTDRYAARKEKNLEFKLTLAGDMHHYTSFRNRSPERQEWLITAGGGGAFTHPTHFVPDELEMGGRAYERSGASPDPGVSKKMAFRNLKFPLINLRFGAFFALLYALFGWITGAADTAESGSLVALLSGSGLSEITGVIGGWGAFLGSHPGHSLFLLVLFGGIAGFADTKRKKAMGPWIAGLLHGLVQVALLLGAVWLNAWLVVQWGGWAPEALPGIFAQGVGLALCGWWFSGLAMGLYLLISSLLLHNHETESFSSFRATDYKNFLRMHLHKEGLTFYPVSVPDACHNWNEAKNRTGREAPWVEPAGSGSLASELIEGPFTIQ